MTDKTQAQYEAKRLQDYYDRKLAIEQSPPWERRGSKQLLQESIFKDLDHFCTRVALCLENDQGLQLAFKRLSHNANRAAYLFHMVATIEFLCAGGDARDVWIDLPIATQSDLSMKFEKIIKKFDADQKD